MEETFLEDEKKKKKTRRNYFLFLSVSIDIVIKKETFE